MKQLLALALLLQVLSWAAAQSQLNNALETSNGGRLQITASSVTFDLSTNELLQAAKPGEFALPTSGDFQLAIGMPVPGTWIVQVFLDPVPRRQDSIETIQPSDVWYRTGPSTPQQTLGCTSSPWTRIGAGSTVATLRVSRGAASCRLTVWLRISDLGRLTPGNYTGGLRWAIERASP